MTQSTAAVLVPLTDHTIACRSTLRSCLDEGLTDTIERLVASAVRRPGRDCARAVNPPSGRGRYTVRIL